MEIPTQTRTPLPEAQCVTSQAELFKLFKLFAAGALLLAEEMEQGAGAGAINGGTVAAHAWGT